MTDYEPPFTMTNKITNLIALISEEIERVTVLSHGNTSPKLRMDRLGLSHKPTFRSNYLTPALNLQVIEMTVPDRSNSRNQKYRRKNNLIGFIGQTPTKIMHTIKDKNHGNNLL